MLKLSAALAVPPDLLSPGQANIVRQPRLAKKNAVEVPANFTGLGYEILSVATPALLRTENRRYIELVRGLGPQGVLRVGGIVANYTRYITDGKLANGPKDTVITESALKQFAAFLRAIGWTAIWSVNFAQGTIDQAVQEALAVSKALGPRLLAIEIGNEVDSYSRGQPFRENPYTYEEYRKEFCTWHAAIAKAVPGIHFAAPDTASNVEWVEQMAQDARGKVQLLTTHYYRNGQNHGTVEQLLHPDPRLENVMARLRAASQQSDIPWRICEINSFSGGGRPGISDSFIGALWTLNTMLLLAENGCAGVNMETGVNQLGFVSSYSPIQDDGRGVNSAGAPYYGMLAFAAALSGCHQILPVSPGATDSGIFLYVLGAAGRPRNIVIINMSEADSRISLADLDVERAFILRLAARSPASTSGITFGDAGVDSAGCWQPQSKEWIRQGSVSIPRMSAAVVRAYRGGGPA
jgi:hypothetical protein